MIKDAKLKYSSFLKFLLNSREVESMLPHSGKPNKSGNILEQNRDHLVPYLISGYLLPTFLEWGVGRRRESQQHFPSNSSFRVSAQS